MSCKRFSKNLFEFKLVFKLINGAFVAIGYGILLVIDEVVEATLANFPPG